MVQYLRITHSKMILRNLTREENVSLDLFGRQDKALKGLVVEEVADKIRQKYGASAIKRAASMTCPVRGRARQRRARKL